MLEAKSMYRGGEIIAAVDLESYEEPKQLGLVCPFCSEALFLNSGGVRTRSGKLELINPHFSHYRCGLESQICEKRARSSEGKARIAAIRGEARNQRLKLYNLYLWQMAAEDRRISSKMIGQVASKFGRKYVEQRGINLHREWHKYQSDIYTLSNQVLEEWYSAKSKEVLDVINPDWFNSREWAVTDIKKQHQYFTTKVDLRLHQAICCEIHDFLGTPSAGYVFNKFFVVSLQLAEIALYPKGINLKTFPDSSIMFGIVGFVNGTHWIDQIQKRLRSNSN